MLNNPLMYNDPSGEFLGVIFAIVLSKAFLIGAAVGIGSYLITAAVMGQKITIGGVFKAAIFGGLSGYAAWGIGDIFSTAAITFGNTLLQAGAHGISQGILGTVQGQSFLASVVGGFLGSLGAAGFGKIAGDWAGKAGGQIFFGALSGGIGAELSGGNFWQGAVAGGIVAGLNHAMHEMDGPGDGDDPRNPNNKKRITLKEARENYLRAREERLYQDIQSMGVELHESDFGANGRATINYDQKGFNGVDNALVHGNVTFERVPGNPGYAQVAYVDSYGCRCGAYDFEMHGNPISTRGSWSTMFRNAATAIGGIVNSVTTSYLHRLN